MEGSPLPETFSAGSLTWTDERLWPQFEALWRAEPDALALIDAQGREWRRSDLHEMALAMAERLDAEGVAPRSRVLVEGRKEVATVAAMLAISSRGAIICPYSGALSQTDRTALEERLGHVLRLSIEPGSADARGVSRVVFSPPPPGVTPSADPRDAQAALIGFTSGTTGVPKGVMHGPAALNYAAKGCATVAGLQPGEPILGIVPWDSAPGFTFTVHFSLAFGNPLVIVDPWSPARALELAAQYRCAWAICVPTHLYAMVEAARTGQWSGQLHFRAVAVGGSAMTPELITDARNLLGIEALRMFGMSECMGHSSVRLEDSDEHRFYSDGRPFDGTTDVPFDAALNPLPAGERGQAGVRGPSLFLGYAQQLGDGTAAFAPGGYLLTGDEIVIADDGYMKVVGRIKDQIIRGGFNIDPAEVEAAIRRHAAIAEAVVVSVPHPQLVEQCCAVCRMLPGLAPVSLADLLAHLEREGLSKKKWPEHLLVVDAIAHNANDKPDKKAISAQARAALSLDAPGAA